MWCKSCQQDVPGVLTDNTEAFCCPRCGETLSGEPSVLQSAAEAVGAAAGDGERFSSSVSPLFPPIYDDWEIDEELRHIARELAMETTEPAKSPTMRIDMQDARAVPAPHTEQWASDWVNKIETVQARGVLPFLTWVAMLLGTMTVVCGGVLLIWSRVASRPELWRIGQPIALGGVCCLIVAMVLQLDRFWQEKRVQPATPQPEPRPEAEPKAMSRLLGDLVQAGGSH